MGAKKMTAIYEEADEGKAQDQIGKEELYEDEEEGNSSVTIKKRQNELLIGKQTTKLISEKNVQLDKYGKNLIKYYDVINHVVSERKRKNNPVRELQNINTDQNRKGAQSLFTNMVPF
mmetsp:Transcript_2134/g.2029  ORF Transcript_2134/g.2029 Transcript_2134/m.2029 type:complete len:118 (-) Transcript_2134:222-575(-)